MEGGLNKELLKKNLFYIIVSIWGFEKVVANEEALFEGVAIAFRQLKFNT